MDRRNRKRAARMNERKKEKNGEIGGIVVGNRGILHGNRVQHEKEVREDGSQLAAIVGERVEIGVVAAHFGESVADRGDLGDVRVLTIQGSDESGQERGRAGHDFDTVLILHIEFRWKNDTFCKMNSRVGQISLFEKWFCSSRSISTMLAIQRKIRGMTLSEALFRQFTKALGIPRSTNVYRYSQQPTKHKLDLQN